MEQIKRFDVWDVELNPTKGNEINKTRPCVIVSPNEANKHLNTVIVVPMTTTSKPYPTRLDCKFLGEKSQLIVDQIRSVDKSRLTQKLGVMDLFTNKELCYLLVETFKY